MHKKLAVIGLACNYPGAKTPLELWENVLAKRQQFRKMPDERLPLADYHDPEKSASDKTYSKQAAVIDGFNFDWQSHRIPKSTVESTDIVHWLALETALAAIKDAGYSAESLPNNTTGAIVGNTLTGEFTRANTMRLRWPYVKKVLQGVTNKRNYSPDEQAALLQEMEIAYKSVIPEVDEDTLAGGLSNTIAGRICNYLNLHGGGYTVDGACASSILAVNVGATYLANGDMDMVIVGGVDVSLDPFEIVGFSKTGALTDSEMRVYDSRGNGFIPGEGCGFAVLKRLEDAKKDGDYVYAELDGWGISSDGKGGITAPSAGGQSQALKNAYKKAKVSPQALDFIEGHGTGTKVGDRTELMGIVATLNETEPAKEKSVGMTSFKSIVGHTKAAAGIGAFIKTVIATNQRILPPTSGCELPHDVFQNEGKSLYPLIKGESKPSESKLRAGVSAMGFGGINSHVTMASGDAPSKKLQPKLTIEKILASPQDSEVFFIAESTGEALQSKLNELAEEAEKIAIAELPDLAAHLAETCDFSAQYRVAIVAKSPEDLFQKLKEKAAQSPQKSPEKPPRISLLFPGQGSQVINMARLLIDRHDWAKATIENELESAEKFIKTPEKAHSEAEIGEWKDTLRATQNAQPCIILASLIWLKFLDRCGIMPNQVAGHSLGELLAFYKAGAMSEKDLLEFAKLRGSLMQEHKGNGGMLSLSCNESQASALIKESQTNLHIANTNAPMQTIVSGDLKEIETLSSIAEANKVSSLRLNVSNAFHSPFVEKAAKKLKEKMALKKGVFKNTSGIKLVSTKTGSEIKEIDLKSHFSEQITEPVSFIKTIKAMANETDIFIEVGPKSVLTSLVHQISEAENADLKIYPTESKAETMWDINTLLAELFENGYPLKTEVLYKDRLIRPYTRPQDRVFIRNPLEREILNAQDLSIKSISKPVAASIGTLEDLGFSPSEQLQTYFHNRKDFLRDMITADMKNTIPNTALKVPEPTQVQASTIPAITTPNVEITKPILINDDLSDIIYTLVEEKTGFSKSSLSMDLKLLDDLNMDSIKAGEFIGNLSEKCGISGKIDQTQHSNATLAEIADLIDQIRDKSETMQGESQESYFEEKDPGWVRQFVMTPKTDIDITSLQVATEAETLLITNNKTLYALNISKISSKDLTLKALQEKSNIILGLQTSGTTKTDIETLHTITNLAITPNIKSITIIEDTKGTFIPASAFLASVHLENPSIKLRAITIDWSKTEKSKTLTTLSQVLATLPNAPHQRLYLNKKNQLHQLEATLHHNTPKKSKLGEKDLILVTGGAKGITAECALELAKKYNSTMALVGSSPKPSPEESSEIHRTLDAYRAENLSAEYYSCDVTDPKDVQTLIAEIESKQGKITALIHGAGINKPKRQDQVQVEDAIGECLPKVEGAKNLLAALKDNPLKLIVGFSSIIGVTGMPGNAWYAYSNQALSDSLNAHKANHPETQVLSMAYSVWDEIGMGAKLGSTEGLKKLGIFPIPKKEGISAFMQLIDSETDNQEVIITAALGGLDTWYYPEYEKPEASRFLQNIERYTKDVYLRANPILSHEDDLYLRDHNFEGSYLFPTVFGLEAMAQAVAYLTGRQEYKELVIRDIHLDRPISVAQDAKEPIIIEAKVESYKNNTPDKVYVTIRPKRTSIPDPYFSATFHLQEPPSKNPNALKLPKTPTKINAKTDLYGPILFQGPLFQRMGTIHELTDKTNLFEILPTDPEALIQKTYSPTIATPFILGDPYARDTLLQSVQASIPKDLSLPVSIARYNLNNLTLPISYCNLTVLEKTSRHHLSNVTATNESGQTQEQLNTYKTKVIRNRFEEKASLEIFTKVSNSFGGVTLISNFFSTFKDIRNKQKTMGVVSICEWMGKFRELALSPIGDEFNKLLKSEKWAFITNYIHIKIHEEIDPLLTIEGRLRVLDLVDSEAASKKLAFEWVKPNTDEIIAQCEMKVTWGIINRDHSITKSKFPECFQKLINSLSPKVQEAKPLESIFLNGNSNAFFKEKNIFVAMPISIRRMEMLREETNLVGNVYFSVYLSKISDTIDMFLKKYFESQSPTSIHGIGYKISNVEINYFKEIFAFEIIDLNMYLNIISEEYVDLIFKFENQNKENLASANVRIEWLSNNHKTILPNEIINYMISAYNKRNNVNKRVSTVNERVSTVYER